MYIYRKPNSLPKHFILAPASSIDGGGWKLVRHAPAGNRWHKATDQLRGTESYGVPCGATCDEEWSIKFDNIPFDQFLFATGDEKKWLIADKDVVFGGWYRIGLRGYIVGGWFGGWLLFSSLL